MKDVLIVGGGLIGLAAGCALKQLGLDVTIVDVKPPQPSFNPDQYALRVSAINNTSMGLFKLLGMADALLVGRVGPFESMRVWDERGKEIEFHAADTGQQWLGHLIENAWVEDCLLERYQALGGEFVVGKPQQVRLAPAVELMLEDGQELSAELLIGADGANSWVRNAVGIQTETTSYEQKGLVGVIKHEKPHKLTAYQRFLPTGPLAFLPLDNPYLSSIVWTLPTDMADEYSQLNETEFCERLGEAFQHTLGEVSCESIRACFPLKRHHAKQYVKERVCLLGDAAHAIHPLAGQGANLGFADVVALSSVMTNAIEKQRPIYSLHTLSKIERLRRRDNALMLNTMTGLNALFSNDKPMLKTLRNVGVSAVNQIDCVKYFLAKESF